MARKIDPAIETILKECDLKAADVLWDCHGTWVMYHSALEKVAAEQRITFERPSILENDGAHKSVAICVVGTRGDRSEWSIGEAAPGNNKNSYPWAMAEKRAKDRVILKLIGLHGLVYSEDEMYGPAPAPAVARLPAEPPADNTALASAALGSDLIKEIRGLRSLNALDRWAAANKERIGSLREPDKERVRGEYAGQRKAITQSEGMAA